MPDPRDPHLPDRVTTDTHDEAYPRCPICGYGVACRRMPEHLAAVHGPTEVDRGG